MKKLHPARPYLLAPLALACGAAWAQPALNPQANITPIEAYWRVYPEWKVQEYETPSVAGTRVGNMGTLRNDTEVLSRSVTPRAKFEDHEWSDSFVGIRGAFAGHGWTVGYNLEANVDLQGSVTRNAQNGDRWVWVEHPLVGRISYGRFDSIYRDSGDRVRMLGVSSANFVSTARVLSNTGWRASGATTFNSESDRHITWVSPIVNGFDVGLGHAHDSAAARAGLRSSLHAAALRWRGGPWYAALQTEIHRNYLPMSLNLDPAAPLPAATSIRNNPITATSRDQAWRISMGWSGGPWRVGADLSRLRYAETDTAAAAGKFRNYENTTMQASAEYRANPQLRLAANHARASAGSCELSGGVACSTHGLGGHQSSAGALYEFSRGVGLFALVSRVHNGPAAIYGSSAQGASTTIYGVGLSLRSN